MATKQDILNSLAQRSPSSRYGISTAASYLKSLDACFSAEGGLCPRHMNGVSGEKWASVLKEASEKLTYCTRGMNVKGTFDATDPQYLMEFNCIISSRRKDRDGDVLDPAGAVLDKHAPLLWQHNPMFPIGRVLAKTKQDNQKIAGRCAIAKFEGNSELGAMARDAATLIQCGGLRISHGFDPRKFRPLDEDEGRWLIESYEILEVSLVSIPSNVDAIIESFSRGKLHSPVIKGWAEKQYQARPVQGIGFTPKSRDCHCGGKCADCQKSSGTYRHEGESMQDCVSRKIEINLHENPSMSQAQASAIAYSECGEKRYDVASIQNVGESIQITLSPKSEPSEKPMAVAKEMQSERTEDVNRQETPAPAHRVEDDRNRGQGPQAGDHDFAGRHMQDEEEPDPTTESTGRSSTNPLGSSMSDEAGRIATGAAGAQNPEGTNPLDGEQNSARMQSIATGNGGKAAKGANDAAAVQPLDADSVAHHTTSEDVNTHVDVDIPGMKSVARMIQHSGKAGHAYIHKGYGAVHHVAHPDDFHPQNVPHYHQPGEIHKMYKSVAGVKSVKISYEHPQKSHGYDLVHHPGTSLDPDNDKSATPESVKAGRQLSAKNLARMSEAKGHLEHVMGMPGEHASPQAKAMVKAAHTHVADMIKDHHNVAEEVEYGSPSAGIAEDVGHEPTDAGRQKFGDDLADAKLGPDMFSVGEPLAGRPAVRPTVEALAMELILRSDEFKNWDIAEDLVGQITKSKQEFDLEVELRRSMDTANGLSGKEDGLGSEEELRSILMRELAGTVAE